MKSWHLLVALLPLLLACARALTPEEQLFSQSIFGDQLRSTPVSLSKFPALGAVTMTRQKRPRLACRERIWPEPSTETVTVGTASFVLFNRIFFSEDYYLDNYLKGYPERLPLVRAMLLSHELTHVWQWQNRDITKYTPLKAAAEHQPGVDPYLLDLTSASDFLSFAYEQQASIVEEFTCCRALDPLGARTQRLRDMLGDVLPAEVLAANLPSPPTSLPWQGAQVIGICT